MRRNYARHIVTGALRFFSGAVPNEILNGTPRHWAFYEMPSTEDEALRYHYAESQLETCHLIGESPKQYAERMKAQASDMLSVRRAS